ncbi:MAG: hypothetical protein P9L90_03310 [Candidatus Aadella gelida]|nr:hypothetical protein [Candidatus Aadella gelida]
MMNNEFTEVIEKTQKLLSDNHEWKDRYENYARGISDNIEGIKNIKKKFHQWAPLYIYMNVGEAKGSASTFNLRYLGQAVADLNIANGDVKLKGKKEKEKNTCAIKNKRDFNCDVNVSPKGVGWREEQAVEFRRHFSKYPIRTKDNNKGNEEHRIESMLLTEFSKNKGKDKRKELHNIQPVLMAKKARFQMPTPLSASDKKNIKYSGTGGGGIDIMARVGGGRGNGTKFCIVEVKDEYLKTEPPKTAIKQALVYATFIRELLRSEQGDIWWRIFGRGGKVLSKLKICVTCAMPFPASDEKPDKSFGGNQLNIGEDVFELHYIYFREETNRIKHVETSLRGNK